MLPELVKRERAAYLALSPEMPTVLEGEALEALWPWIDEAQGLVLVWAARFDEAATAFGRRTVAMPRDQMAKQSAAMSANAVRKMSGQGAAGRPMAVGRLPSIPPQGALAARKQSVAPPSGIARTTSQRFPAVRNNTLRPPQAAGSQGSAGPAGAGGGAAASTFAKQQAVVAAARRFSRQQF